MVYEAISQAGTSMAIQVYIATAFLSGLTFLYLSRVWDNLELKYFLVHFFIVAWSGMMYLNFLSESIFSNFTWYMDWMLSTPLILTALGFTALHGADEKRWDLLGGLIGLQFMLVISGIISQSMISNGATGFIGEAAFWLGSIFLLGVVYLLWGPLRQIAQDTSDMLGRHYTYLAGYISVFFLLYPTVWYISGVTNPNGMAVLDNTATSLAFVVLPFFCKQVYGFLDLYLLHQADQEM